MLIAQWYDAKPWGKVLWPLSKLFEYSVILRKYCYDHNIFAKYRAAVPVIIVGNLTVGGTGKTPLVIYLAHMLAANGYRPGIVSRGYKGQVKSVIMVSPHSNPKVVSDEAVLLANRSQCPVMVSKKRAVGVQQLIQHNKVNVIICDDGLQHYGLQRDIEIAVIDGVRMFGNGYSLPMGPLREPETRLESVDLIVVSGKPRSDRELAMELVCTGVYSLKDPENTRDLKSFKGAQVHAVAGIGYPEKFFQHLRHTGLDIIPHPFPDHHEFSPIDIEFADNKLVLMTEKDAVKTKHFASDRHWVVAISAKLPKSFEQTLLRLIKELKHD